MQISPIPQLDDETNQIRLMTAELVAREIADRAIQVHGALGLSADLPLGGMCQGARTLRLADGPDEVHRILIAKNVLAAYHRCESWDFGS
jgi:alkylation response protein AidB-like acyl-CoA dehydrogenase